MDVIRVVWEGIYIEICILKVMKLALKITSFKAMKGGAVCLILEPLRTFTSSFIEMKTAGKVCSAPQLSFPPPPPHLMTF